MDLGLYRDDGLGVCRLSARQTEILKKKMCALFAELGLRITTDVNHKKVNFLDVTLDLTTGEFKPYMKPNNTILYVNRLSDHPLQYLETYPKILTEDFQVCPVMRKFSKRQQGLIKKPFMTVDMNLSSNTITEGWRGGVKEKIEPEI